MSNDILDYDKKLKYLMKILVSQYIQNTNPRYAEYIKAYFEYLNQEFIDDLYNINNLRDAYNMTESFIDDSLNMFFHDMIDPDLYDIETDNKRAYIDLSKKIMNMKGNEKSFYFLLRSLSNFTTIINGEEVTFEKITMELEEYDYWWIPGDDRYKVDPFQSLISHYSFDNILTDLTVNNLDLTAYNSPTFVNGIDDEVTTAISFNGTTQYCDYNSTYLGKLNNIRTFSCWVNPISEESHGTNLHILLSKSTDYQYGLYIDYVASPNLLVVNFKQSDGTLETASYTIPDHSEWYHIAGVYDTDNYVKLFINGNLVDTSTSSLDGTFYDYSTAPIYIGGGVTNRYSSCYIDDTQVFKEALTEEEIYMIYLLRGDTSINFIGTINETLPSKAAHWKLDDISNTIIDSSGNNNTMTGTTFVSSDWYNWSPINEYSLYLDGTDYATAAGSASIDDIRSWTCWFFPKSEQSSGSSYHDIITNNGVGLYIDYDSSPNKFRFTSKQSDGTAKSADSKDILNYNTWYFIVGIYDSDGNTKIYINNELILTVNDELDGTTYDLSSTTTTIGSSTRDTVGYIEDIQLFQDTLTEDQIESMYHDKGRKIYSTSTKYELNNLIEKNDYIEVYPQGDDCNPFTYRFTVDQTYSTIESIIDSVHPVGYFLEYVLRFDFGVEDEGETLFLEDDLDFDINYFNIFNGEIVHDGSANHTGTGSADPYIIEKIPYTDFVTSSLITDTGLDDDIVNPEEIWDGIITYEEDNTVDFTFTSPLAIKDVYIKVDTIDSTNPYNFSIEGYDTSWDLLRSFDKVKFDTDIYKALPINNSTDYSEYRINFHENRLLLLGLTFKDNNITDWHSETDIDTDINSSRLILFDETNVTETKAINEPYIHDTHGLRTMPSSVNLLLYSEDLINAAWTKTNANVVSDGIVFPSITAYRITQSTTAGYISQTTVLNSDEYYSYLMYIKEGNTDDILIKIQTDVVSSKQIDIEIVYNFTTGTTVTNNDISGLDDFWINATQFGSNFKLEFGFKSIENFTTDGFQFGPNIGGSIGDYVLASIIQKTNTKLSFPYIPNTGTTPTIETEGNFTGTDGNTFDVATNNTDLEDLLFSVSVMPQGEIEFEWTPEFNFDETNDSDDISNIFTFYNSKNRYVYAYNDGVNGHLRFLPEISGLTTPTTIQYDWTAFTTISIKITFGKPGTIFATANGLDTSKYYFRISIDDTYFGNFIEYTNYWDSDTTNYLRFGYLSENIQYTKNITFKDKPKSWIEGETDSISVSNIILNKEGIVDV